MIHHTNCGLEGSTEDEVAERTGVKGMTFLTFADVEASVLEDVETVRGRGHLPYGFVVGGAVYDVDDGAIRVVAPPD